MKTYIYLHLYQYQMTEPSLGRRDLRLLWRVVEPNDNPTRHVNNVLFSMNAAAEYAEEVKGKGDCLSYSVEAVHA